MKRFATTLIAFLLISLCFPKHNSQAAQFQYREVSQIDHIREGMVYYLSLNDLAHALESEIAVLTQEQQDLEAVKAYYSSPAYVEAWAHDQGKMVRAGEILVIPVYDKHARAGLTVTSSEPARPLPTWHVWWSLFLDSPLPFSSSTQMREGAP